MGMEAANAMASQQQPQAMQHQSMQPQVMQPMQPMQPMQTPIMQQQLPMPLQLPPPQKQDPAQLQAANFFNVPGLATRPSAFSGISRQTSIYSLTLDEFQNAFSDQGQKQNFGSMNMDEFLKNIWTAEENQAMAAAMAAGADQQQVGLAKQTSLQRQSSLTLPRTLSRKTVDEVWKDIHNSIPAEPGTGGQQRQVTFGEMTLEDFLVKAGVVREDFNPAAGGGLGGSTTFAGPYVPSATQPFQSTGVVQPTAVAPSQQGTQGQSTMEAIQNAANQQQAEWQNYQQQTLQLQQHQQQQQLLQQQAAEAAAAFVTAHKRAAAPTLSNPPPPLNVAALDRPTLDIVPLPSPTGQNGLSPTNPSDSTPRGKKRGTGEIVEKVVERRQRRMIKNRESAARSRARKQAYTVELEAEVNQLKEENARLRRIAQQAAGIHKDDDKSRNSLLDTLAQLATRESAAVSTGTPRRSLRRTQTGPW